MTDAPIPTPRRTDWLLLTTAGMFKFTLLGFYMVAVMAMLKSYGYTLGQLSWVYLLGGAEAAKVLFAVPVERFRFPRFGRFRFWMLVSAAGIVLVLLLLMQADPRNAPVLLLSLCFLLSCLSVVFGCASVGLGCVLLPFRERGFGGVIQVAAARAGRMIGGALVLWIYQGYGWRAAVGAVWGFAVLMLLQILFYREPESTVVPHEHSFGVLFKRFAGYWWETEHGARWFWLLFCSCIPYALASSTFVPRLADSGWQPQQIGAVLAVAVPVACMLAAPCAGYLARRYPRRKLVCTLLAVQVVTMASFAAEMPAAVMAVQIVLLNMGYTLLLPVVMALMMDKARAEYAAFDSALQLSVLLAGTYLAGFVSLRLAAAAGYPAVYLLAAGAGAALAQAVRRLKVF